MTTTERPSVVMPADWVAGPPQGQWTYDAYAALPEDGQWYEIVKGVLYMAPSPEPRHQSVGLEIASYLRQFVQLTRLGQVFYELDVKLSLGTVVRPDVIVLLNEHLQRIGEKCIIGTPDLVVEILSPRTMRHDVHGKLDAYEQAQVPEYWIVSPGERTIEVLLLEDGTYRSAGVFQGKETLPTRIVPDMPVAVEQFFAFL